MHETQSAPVLFLDVDGVLNHEAVFKDRRFGPAPLDYLCIEQLHRVALETGCQVVLSSAWRGGGILERKLIGCFVFENYRHGRASIRHDDGSTKYLETKRGEEIAEWLSRHPEVQRYAIVDDDADMLPEQTPFFVQTSFDTGGLTSAHADRLIAILSGPTLPANE